MCNQLDRRNGPPCVGSQVVPRGWCRAGLPWWRGLVPLACAMARRVSGNACLVRKTAPGSVPPEAVWLTGEESGAGFHSWTLSPLRTYSTLPPPDPKRDQLTSGVTSSHPSTIGTVHRVRPHVVLVEGAEQCLPGSDSASCRWPTRRRGLATRSATRPATRRPPRAPLHRGRPPGRYAEAGYLLI